MASRTDELADELDLVALVGYPLAGFAPGSTGEALAELERAAREVYADYLKASRIVRTDPRLSDAGRKSDLGGIAGREAARLDSLYGDRERQVLEAKMASLRKAMAVSPQDPSNAADKLEELWRRDWIIEHVEDLEVPGVFNRAITEGDEITFRAILNAPRFLNFLSDDARKQGERAWAVAHSPERARELAGLERAKRALERTLATLRGAMYDDAGVEQGDPLDALAGSAAAEAATDDDAGESAA